MCDPLRSDLDLSLQLANPSYEVGGLRFPELSYVIYTLPLKKHLRSKMRCLLFADLDRAFRTLLVPTSGVFIPFGTPCHVRDPHLSESPSGSEFVPQGYYGEFGAMLHPESVRSCLGRGLSRGPFPRQGSGRNICQVSWV